MIGGFSLFLYICAMVWLAEHRPKFKIPGPATGKPDPDWKMVMRRNRKGRSRMWYVRR